MSNIMLKSDVLEVIEVKKKTRADMFKDLKVGNKIQLSIPVKRAGKTTRGGTQASYICIENLDTGDYTYKTFNEVPKFLELFNLKEVE